MATPVVVTWKPDPALRAGLTLTIPRTPKAKRDRTSDAWSERVSASIKPDPSRNAERYIGRDAGQGYVLLATDGHRALCRYADDADNPLGRPLASIDSMARVDLPPGFDLGLTRARAVLKGRTPHKPVTLTIADGRVTIDAVFPGVAESREHFDVDTEPNAGATLIVDVDYLIAGLGRPMAMYYRPGALELPIVLSPTDDPMWRYVVATMRA